MSIVNMYDSFRNFVANLGTGKDKAAHGEFYHSPKSDAELEAQYMSDWLSGKVVDVPVNDSTRKWRKISAPSIKDQIETVEIAETEIGIRGAFNSAQKWADVYGGAITLMVVNDGKDPAEPLVAETVKQGDLSHLIVFDKTEVSQGGVNTTDVMDKRFRLPTYYTIPGGTNVHASRCLWFRGIPVPYRLRQNYAGWDQSRLQRVMGAMRNVAHVTGGISSLIYEAKNDIISIPNLFEEISSPEGSAKMIERFALADQMKSINNTVLLDDREVFTRVATSFAALPELLQKFLLIGSAASDIPATKILGQSAIGMNSTGESEERDYYDRVEGDQENRYRPLLSWFDQIFARSTLGYMPDDWAFEFNPLGQISETEQSDIDLKNAQRDAIYLQNDVLDESQIARELRENGTYGSVTSEYVEALEATAGDDTDTDTDTDGGDLGS